MKHFPWWYLGVLFAFLAGLGLGLTYAWIIAPQHLTDSEPATLRSDFKDQFRTVIAASYAATGNLPRAQARLLLLDEGNLTDSLNAQAQRDISNGQFQQADQLAALALALANGTNLPPQYAVTPGDIEPVITEPSLTLFPTPEDIPFVITETPGIIETQSIAPQPIPDIAAPRPTRTAPPTQGPPFQLTSFDTVCDNTLPDNLLQVIVYNASRRQIAGIEILVRWDSGEEQFFTGLKPELGNGYADFLMEPGTSYSIQLALGSEVAKDIIPPTCQASNGESFTGGYKLTFQQP